MPALLLLLTRCTPLLGCLQGLLEEATFYDKQWDATWAGQERPKESEA